MNFLTSPRDKRELKYSFFYLAFVLFPAPQLAANPTSWVPGAIICMDGVDMSVAETIAFILINWQMDEATISEIQPEAR